MESSHLEKSVDKKVYVLPTKTSISIPIPIKQSIPKNSSFEHDFDEEYSLKSNKSFINLILIFSQD